MVLALLFAGVTQGAFAVFSAVNVGPTTDFQGDINTTGGIYINSTLIAFGDITEEQKRLHDLKPVNIGKTVKKDV